jgi:hypothetical protein
MNDKLKMPQGNPQLTAQTIDKILAEPVVTSEYNGPKCGHSVCRQYYIDTGGTECIDIEDLEFRLKQVIPDADGNPYIQVNDTDAIVLDGSFTPKQIIELAHVLVMRVIG